MSDKFFTRLTAICILVLALGGLSLPQSSASSGELKIDFLGISPRDVAESPDDIFDQASSGINVVGIGQKVYLGMSIPNGQIIGSASWSVSSRPTGSTALLSSTTDPVVTFVPDVAGVYRFRLETTDGEGAANPPLVAELIVARYVGAGVFNTHDPDDRPRAPQCGTGFCHGGSNADPALNVSPEWVQSGHATKLIRDLNGETADHYAVYCLPCHSVGFDQSASAINGGFDDVAADIGFDLNQIPQLVEEAAHNNIDNFEELPPELQNMASIQCENCHGAGSLHPQRLLEDDLGIAGVDLGFDQCKQCHDSASGFQQGFYEWNASSHPITAEAGEGHVLDIPSCLKCHTGEGFIDVQVEGKSPQFYEEFHSVTCSTCHDPHFTENPHQLRVVGAFTLDSGHTFEEPGLGGICVRCHNSRVSDAQNTALNSFRGAHYGTQGDMILGVNGVDFGLEFERNSAHIRAVDDLCVECHMTGGPGQGPGQIETPLVGGHSFSMRDTLGTPEEGDDIVNVENACATCHDGLTTYNRTARADYDGDGVKEGVQDEVSGLLAIMTDGILATMPGTSFSEESGKIEISGSDFANLGPMQRLALYNTNFVLLDGSLGVHNTAYAVQLLQRSYVGIFDRVITDDYPQMVLRGPVAANNAERWQQYE